MSMNFGALAQFLCWVSFISSLARKSMGLQQRHLSITQGDTSLDVPMGRYPSIVSIRKFGAHFCGGALIDSRWALTAAHCVDGQFPRSIRGKTTVHVGAYFLNNTTDVDMILTSATFVHDKWNGDLFSGFDVALLLLSKASSKEPMKLAQSGMQTDSEHLNGQRMMILGWGDTSSDGEFSDVLQGTHNSRIVPKNECSDAWGANIGDEMLCVRPRIDVPGERICDGDSGSPLILSDTVGEGTDADGNRTDILVGIASFGPQSCGEPKDEWRNPDVFTNVSFMASWIEDTVRIVNYNGL